MAQAVTVVGIDVSKSCWEVARYPDVLTASFPTDADGQAALLAWLFANAPGATVACEASGGWERPLIELLIKADIAVRRLDARRVRRFAEAAGRRAKNDRIDAAVIAHYAATFPGPGLVPDVARERLAEWVRLRDGWEIELTAAGNRGSHLTQAKTRQVVARHQAALRRWIAKAEAEIVAIIAASARMAERRGLMESVRGIGLQTTASVLAYLPEFGEIGAKPATALAGIAPFDHDSGSHRGQRSIKGGRWRLRRSLYMAAMAGIVHNPVLRDFYRRLRARGKPAKVALVAVMRKLLVILTAIVRTQTPWNPVRSVH